MSKFSFIRQEISHRRRHHHPSWCRWRRHSRHHRRWSCRRRHGRTRWPSCRPSSCSRHKTSRLRINSALTPESFRLGPSSADINNNDDDDDINNNDDRDDDKVLSTLTPTWCPSREGRLQHIGMEYQLQSIMVKTTSKQKNGQFIPIQDETAERQISRNSQCLLEGWGGPRLPL